MSDITPLLRRMEQGEAGAAAELLPMVYGELRQLARARLAREAPGQTIQATVLVHDAWQKLCGDGGARPWNGRKHFFAAAARVMRNILVDNARRKRAGIHGGDLVREAADGVLDQIAAPRADTDEILAVHESLERLAAHDARKARLVELRYFVGLTLEEAAEVLGVSLPTVKRDWAYARAWLFRDISQEL